MSARGDRAIAMIGVDLDGTLLGPDGTVGAAEADALRAAADCGVTVVPCTGRAHHEAAGPLAGLPGLELGVFATGGTVNRLANGAVVDATHFDPALAADLIEALAPLPEAVLVYGTRERTGFDYTVTGSGALTPNTAWWFEQTRARVRHVDALSDDNLTHVVRVAVVSNAHTLQPHLDALRTRFGDHIESHSFGGVERAEDNPVQILEVFPRGVTKWQGLTHAAGLLGVDAIRIGVIGDEVNDAPAFAGASLSVAMGNAIPAIRDAADHHVADNRSGGAAEAIHWLLAQ